MLRLRKQVYFTQIQNNRIVTLKSLTEKCLEFGKNIISAVPLV